MAHETFISNLKFNFSALHRSEAKKSGNKARNGTINGFYDITNEGICLGRSSLI
jgi:hypothetical protein